MPIIKRRKIYVFVIAWFLIFQLTSINVMGNEIEEDSTPKVLVVFSSENHEIDQHQRVLDMLIGHFTVHVTFKSTLQFEAVDLNEIDYLFYYGQVEEELPKLFVDSISTYEGPIISLGYNIDQLGEIYNFIKWLPDKVVIDEAVLNGPLNKSLAFIPTLIFDIALVDGYETETILTAINISKQDYHPLFVHSNNRYYFAVNTLIDPFSTLFAEVLNDVIVEPPLLNFGNQNPGYIRLEDVHPLVDPESVMEIGKILAEKNIPYMIAVIPVYTNPETQKQYHFSDSPKLVKALKFMQENGGSIVLHGYTHQFRLSETGEGFEFWDVENNMPIYHDQDDEVVVKIREDFNSEQEYLQYLYSQKEFERNYIEERLIKGIQELSNYGLYPLAFEAPHYTMSQHGYQVVSDFFTTYVGQMQLSDLDWEIMTTTPTITKPTFLHGMLLLPETLGYVLPEDPQAIDKMVQKAHKYKFARNGMVAGFFHPYLGVDLFKQFLAEIEQIPNVSWIDLKQLNNRVQTDNVEIQSIDGEVLVDINYIGLFTTSWDYLSYHIWRIVNFILWLFAGLGGLAVLIFIINTIIISRRHRKEGNRFG